MKLFQLTAGLVVRHGERSYQLERHLEDGTLVFVDRIAGRPMSLSVGEFWRKLKSKKLILISGVTTEFDQDNIKSSNLICDLSSYPEKYQNEANRRFEYIQAMRSARLSKGMRRQINDCILKIAAEVNDENPPSSSTVMRWMRDLDKMEQNPLALMSRHALLKRPKRKSEETLRIAREVLRTYYCKPSRPSLKSALRETRRQLDLLIKNGKISPEDGVVSASTFARLKNEIDPYALDLARYGSSYTKNKWRYSLSGPNVVRAMQRYEVDHTIVDVVCVCDQTGLPLGRPTLTIVVDAYSSYVVGIYISFWGTGLAPTFRALQVAFSPKDEFNKILDPATPWLGYGLCDMLALDNGLEFHSPQFKMMAMQLCIDIQYCAVRQPWLKPFVERALGKYLEYLPVPGRVRKPLNNELPESSDKTAGITFSSLCDGLLRAFVGIHPYEINERKISRPVDLYKESVAGLPPVVLSADMDDLEIIVAPSKLLKIGNEGVVTNYLRFNSKELQSIRRSTEISFKTVVKFDPDDLGHVWVQDVKTKSWLMVPSVNPNYSKGLSLIQHKAIREHARGALSERNAEEKLLKAKLELADLWANRTKQGKKIKREHLRVMSGLTSGKVLLGSGVTSEVVNSNKIITTEELKADMADIPDFGGFRMY